MYPRWIILLPVFILCCACAHTRQDSKQFLFEEELTATHRVPTGEPVPPNVSMHILRDYLVFLDHLNLSYSVEYFFHAYRLFDLSFVGSFGRRGRGPGEWNNPDIVHSSSMSPYLYLFELSSRESTAIIHKMALDTLAQLKEVRTFSIDKGRIPMNDPVIKNDSLLVFREFTPDHRALRMYHLQEERPVITWDYGGIFYPKIFSDENNGILRANDSRIIFIYRYKEMIDFMDWDLNLKKRLNYQKGKPVITDNHSNNKIHTTNTYLGEHFLYIFYSGMSPNERLTKSNLNLGLEVFDMDGTPVCRYSFIDPTPFTFVVDERTFTLYGYKGSDGMEDYISVYHLPGLKEYLQNR